MGKLTIQKPVWRLNFVPTKWRARIEAQAVSISNQPNLIVITLKGMRERNETLERINIAVRFSLMQGEKFSVIWDLYQPVKLIIWAANSVISRYLFKAYSFFLFWWWCGREFWVGLVLLCGLGCFCWWGFLCEFFCLCFLAFMSLGTDVSDSFMHMWMKMNLKEKLPTQSMLSSP